jgi:hypothetical protein
MAPPPGSTPPPRPRLPLKPKGPPPEPLPAAGLRARIIAPSAQGPWTLRLENEGSHWVRVPADLRLLRISVESGDTMSRRAGRPVKCALPAGLRPEGFPERNALLLGPGDAYVESFDPRLFCFGKEGKALAGGAVVRATYGWDAVRGAKKLDPPFAVEGTAFPAAVEPEKGLVVPTLVLSWLPPPEEEEPTEPVVAPPPPPTAPPGPVLLLPMRSKTADQADPDGDGEADPEPAPAPIPERQAEPPAPLPPDANAARLELRASPFADAGDGHHVSLTLTVTNVGHRPATAAIRSRMAGFRVEGPDGLTRCHPAPADHGVPREGFLTLKPGASTALTILVAEACGQEVFRRPGLYRVTSSLHLAESGADLGLAAITGRLHTAEPTLVRIATGPDPFYRRTPKAVRAPHHEESAAQPEPGTSP